MTVEPLTEYYQALERLIKGCPKRVPKGTKITNDSVALEAGRGKGSIKKSRKSHSDLISDICAAAKQSLQKNVQADDQLNKSKQQAKDLQNKLEASYARELSLLIEMFELKKTIAAFQEQFELPVDNVVPILRKKQEIPPNNI